MTNPENTPAYNLGYLFQTVDMAEAEVVGGRLTAKQALQQIVEAKKRAELRFLRGARG